MAKNKNRLKNYTHVKNLNVQNKYSLKVVIEGVYMEKLTKTNNNSVI